MKKGDDAHSFDMFPKTLHIIRRIIPIDPPLPSHQPRVKHRLSATHVSPNRHNTSCLLVVVRLLRVQVLLLGPLHTRPRDRPRPILPKEIIQERLPCC